METVKNIKYFKEALDRQRKLTNNSVLSEVLEGFPSGQRGQTVNLLAQPSEVRILPPPPLFLEL